MRIRVIACSIVLLASERSQFSRAYTPCPLTTTRSLIGTTSAGTKIVGTTIFYRRSDVHLGLRTINDEDDDEDEDFVSALAASSTLRPLATILTAQFVLFLGVGAVIPTIPLYGKAIGLSGAANGLVISAPALASLAAARPSGRYADEVGRRPAVLWGMLVIALSDLGTAAADSLGTLLVARLGLGLGRAASEAGERGTLTDLADRAPERWRGRVVASQQTACALGVAAGAPLGGVVVDAYGPRAAFLCVTAAATITGGVYAAWLEETSTRMTSNAANEKTNDDNDVASWTELLRDPTWRALASFEVGARVGFAAKLASVPVLAASVFSNGATGAGLLLSAAGLCSGLVGGPLGGWLTDRVGGRRALIGGGLVGAASLMAVPVVLSDATATATVTTPAAFAGVVLLWSAAAAAQTPAATALAQRAAPAGSEATATALPRASGDAVYLIAPFLLGAVADRTDLPLGSECAVAGLCGALGVAALLLLTSDDDEHDDKENNRDKKEKNYLVRGGASDGVKAIA